MTPDNSEPTVSIFGKNMDTERWEYETSQRAVWGGLLVFAGIILLFNTFEVIPWTIWFEIFNYWPFLLILSGLQILLGSGLVSRSIMLLITISVFGLVLLSVMQIPYPDLLNEFPIQVQDAVKVLEGLVN